MKEPKKKLLFTAAYIALVLVIIKLAQTFLLPLFANSFLGSLVIQILFAVLAVAGAVLFGKTEGMKLKGKGFGEGMLAGLAFLIIYPILMVASLVSKRTMVTEPVGNIVLFVLKMLLIGVAEEGIFRGVLQNVALEVTGEDTAAAARKGILLAGLVFGLVHLTNMLTGVSVVGTVMQALMAIPMGIVLGAIYFRGCNNILPVILIHALVDGVSFVSSGALSGTTLNDAISDVSTSGGPMAKAATFLVYLALALFLMRKSKMEKAIAAHNEMV